jgi:phenylalanyl-tRNA synthetase alpha chain
MELNKKIEEIKAQINFFNAKSPEEVEVYRIKFIGTKNLIKDLYKELKTVPNELKKEYGQLINELKNIAEDKFSNLKETVGSTSNQSNKKQIDFSRPAEEILLGARHPLAVVKNEIIDVFNKIGFVVSEGPEVEDDWHNFSALNFPP